VPIREVAQVAELLMKLRCTNNPVIQVRSHQREEEVEPVLESERTVEALHKADWHATWRRVILHVVA
jgi:hypothetical protein